MLDNLKIEDIRKSVQKAQSDSQRVFEFMKLLKHPELTWEDLISCLQYRVIIQEQAAFRLHDLLDIKIQESEGVTTDIKEWYKVLESKHIEKNSIIEHKKK